MPSVFSSSPVGTVVQLPGSSKFASIALLGVKGLTDFALGDFNSEKIIITSFNADEQVNVQFNHTMGNDIYLNVFGNRMGAFTLKGIAFNAASGADQNGCQEGDHGIVKVIEWYRANRISAAGAAEISLNIKGQGLFSGYLIGANYGATRPGDYMVEYSLTIATVPR
jgi:hypothetical protein